MGDVFTEGYRKHWDEIYRYFYRVTLNSHTAEELTQDVFYNALRSFLWFRGKAGIRTWLFKIANNTYVTWVRKNKSLPLPEPELTVYSLDPIADSDRRMLLEEVFVRLRDRDRQLITLRDMDGFSYAEIAGILQINEDHVRVGLYRARKRFRKIYADMGGEG